MSDDNAVPYGMIYSIGEFFCAVIVPADDDTGGSVPLRTRLFASSAINQQQQRRTVSGYRACIVAIDNGDALPPWCTVTNLELLADTNGNGLLDAVISIDTSKLPV